MLNGRLLATKRVMVWDHTCTRSGMLRNGAINHCNSDNEAFAPVNVTIRTIIINMIVHSSSRTPAGAPADQPLPFAYMSEQQCHSL